MDNKQCWPCDEPIIHKIPPCPLQCGSKRCRAFKPGPPVDRRPIVWVIGGPSSGKRTQCQKIFGKYGFTHLAIRDLLEAEVKSESDRAKCLASIMKRGERVPNDLVLDLLKESIFSQAEKAKGFVIEGYPRERSEGIAFEKTIEPATVIFYLEASSATLLKRMPASETHSEDEVVESKELRLKRFHENNILVLAEYPEKIARINADGSIDEMFAKIQKILDPIVAEFEAYNRKKESQHKAA